MSRAVRAPLALLLAVAGFGGLASGAARGAPFTVSDGLKPLAGSASCRGLVHVAEALWTTRWLPSPEAGIGKLELVRLDPASGAAAASWPLAERSLERAAPPVLESFGDRIWLFLPGDPVEVVAFDARARKVERRVKLDGRRFQRGLDLAADGARAWALAGGELFRIDAESGAVEPVDLATISNGVALVGGSLWLRTATGTEIHRFDASTLGAQPRLALPSGHLLPSRQFSRTWVAGGDAPAVLLSSRPQNLWTGRPAPDVVAALDAATGALAPALRLDRAILDVEVSDGRAAVVVMSYTKARVDLSLLLFDWRRRVLEREQLLGSRLDPKFPSPDPDYRPSSVALGARAAWVCLADYGVVAVPLDAAR